MHGQWNMSNGLKTVAEPAICEIVVSSVDTDSSLCGSCTVCLGKQLPSFRGDPKALVFRVKHRMQSL